MERDRRPQQSCGIHRRPESLAAGASLASAAMAEFSPPFWLRNAHVQPVYPSFPLRRWGVERRAAPLVSAAKELILDCGAGVRLQAFYSSQDSRHGSRPIGAAGSARAEHLVVLHHGWEGSVESLYILALGQFLFDQGFDVVRNPIFSVMPNVRWSPGCPT